MCASDCDFTMTNVKELYMCIKFCLKLVKLAVEIDRILVQTFHNDTLSQTKMYKCSIMAQHQLILMNIRDNHLLALHQQMLRMQNRNVEGNHL